MCCQKKLQTKFKNGLTVSVHENEHVLCVNNESQKAVYEELK